MIHHYHPPTCKANPALTSLHAPFMLQSRLWHSHEKRTEQAKTRGGTNSFTCMNSHLSFISFFSASTPPLHLPVVDTGGVWFSSRRRFILQRRDKFHRPNTLRHQRLCLYRENSGNFKVQQRRSLSFCPEMCALLGCGSPAMLSKKETQRYVWVCFIYAHK